MQKTSTTVGKGRKRTEKDLYQVSKGLANNRIVANKAGEQVLVMTTFIV
jgi:hypothetical protein